MTFVTPPRLWRVAECSSAPRNPFSVSAANRAPLPDDNSQSYLCSPRKPSPRPSPFLKGRGRNLVCRWSSPHLADQPPLEFFSLALSDGEGVWGKGCVQLHRLRHIAANFDRIDL